jgi:hypothetical protein
MIIYIAPNDVKLKDITLRVAKHHQIRVVAVNEALLLEEKELNEGPDFHYYKGAYTFGDAETIWVVGHGNVKEIGDKDKGVTMPPEEVVSFLISTVINENPGKYTGSIVIDTCYSATPNSEHQSFVDRVYEILKKSELKNATVGGWPGVISGPISGGVTKLDGVALRDGQDGFCWGGGKAPDRTRDQIIKLIGIKKT